MVWALTLFLVLPFAEPPQTTGTRPSFSELARQADEARSADKLPDAIRLYREAVRQRPGWSEGWWWLGSIYYEQDRFPEAQESFRHFVATSPDATAAYAFLGLCEYETRHFDAARRYFSQWALKGSPGDDRLIEVAFFHWALLLTQEGRFPQALFLLQKAAEQHGPNPLLIEAMGLAWLQMRHIPEDYPPEQREMVWLAGSAAVFASRSDFARTQEYAARLVAHYGDRSNVHYFRGMMYSFNSQLEEAEAEFRKELDVTPAHASAMIQLALAQYSSGSQLSEARDFAQKATALEPKNPLGHYALGTILLAQGEAQQSAQELELAAELAPADAKVHLQLGRAYKKLGRTKDFEHEMAVFTAMKDKQNVFATPEEKLQGLPKNMEQVK